MFKMQIILFTCIFFENEPRTDLRKMQISTFLEKMTCLKWEIVFPLAFFEKRGMFKMRNSISTCIFWKKTHSGRSTRSVDFSESEKNTCLKCKSPFSPAFFGKRGIFKLQEPSKTYRRRLSILSNYSKLKFDGSAGGGIIEETFTKTHFIAKRRFYETTN